MSGPWEDFGGSSEGPWSDFAKSADPKIGQPEELTFAEKHIAPLLPEFLGGIAGGNLRGSAVGRVMQGAADPGVALVQMGANAIGQGDAVNKGIADTEQKYQAARAEAGSTGFDPLRMGGNIAMSVLGAGALPALPARLGVMGQAAVTGAGTSLLNPVVDGGENYWKDKAKDAAIGAVVGPLTAKLGQGLARVVSPNASTNAEVALLKAEGVNPTVGQTLGGWANRAEEKLTSLPIMGDRIAAMRNKAIDEFNEAAINRSQAPIGAKVKGFGQDAIAEAGDNLSAAYQKALGSVTHINFDTPSFNANLGQLTQMAKAPGGLRPDLAKKFDRTLTDVVYRRMSPNGSIAGENIKTVDSELGKLASKWMKSPNPSDQEFGEAVKQLQSLLKQEVGAAQPEVAKALKAADAGWANLVRVERAGKAGINNEGRFTPAQLNSAIKGSDQSTRGRASARGEALMQDLGNAGSRLGNRVPDSGTPGRLLLAGVGLGAGGVSAAIPAGLIAGAGAYTPPVQNALRALLTKRPDQAPKVANELRRIMQAGGIVTVPMVEALGR